MEWVNLTKILENSLVDSRFSKLSLKKAFEVAIIILINVKEH
jgi:hypothetical protein